MSGSRAGGALAAVVVVLAALVPLVVTSPYYLQTLTQLVLYGILFVGLDVAVGQAGLVSMAHGALFGIGAYATGVLTVQLGWSFWPTVPVAVVLAGVVGLGVGLVTLRLAGHYFVVATLGLGGVATIVVTNWSSLTGGAAGLSPIPQPTSPAGDWFGTQQGFYHLVLAAAVLVSAGVWLLMRTATGQRLRAIRDNPGLAAAVGVDVARTRLVAFVVSAAVAGLAGAFEAPFVSYINPSIGDLDFAFTALLAVIVGGRASVAGPYLGAVIFVLLPELIRDAEQFRLIALGVALIVVVLFAPDGIAGRLAALARLVRRRARRPGPDDPVSPRVPKETVEV